MDEFREEIPQLRAKELKLQTPMWSSGSERCVRGQKWRSTHSLLVTGRERPWIDLNANMRMSSVRRFLIRMQRRSENTLAWGRWGLV